MTRISTMAVALALCLTLFFITLPQTPAHVYAAPPPEVKQQEKQEKSCATCPSAKAGKKEVWADKLATAGRRTQQMPFIPVQRSLFDGARINLVGTANGSLVFAVTDMKVSGLMALSFTRVYASDRAEDRGLGAGWSFSYDDRIRITGDEAVMSTGASSEIAFRREGQRFVLKTPEPGLHQSFEEAADGALVESSAGLTRTYRKVGNEYRLARIADADGNTITISFDRKGNISRVEGLGGTAINLAWSTDKQPRLLSVTDNTGRRTTYRQLGGHLAAFFDQAGSQWTYKYASGRLTDATDPMGRVVLRARYDRQGRAIETGDAAGSYLFEYAEGGRTVISDPLGVKSAITHNALGAFSSVVDDEGQTTAMEYDANNVPIRVSDSLGNQQTFAGETENKSEPPTSYRVVRNGRGQPLSLKWEDGREITFEYDAAGNETAFTQHEVGPFARKYRSEKRYDGAGRKIFSQVPSGRSFTYAYNERGELAKMTDESGYSLTIERDAGGMISKVTEPSGRWVRFTRDAAGRLTRLNGSDGKSRQYAYDARGALTYYRDAMGRQNSISYDRKGRLQRVDKSDGVTLHYRYGRDGSVASVRREVRGQRPGFVKAGFNLLPPLAAPDFEDEIEGCFWQQDEFGLLYNPCEMDSYIFSATSLVETIWEEARPPRSIIDGAPRTDLPGYYPGSCLWQGFERADCIIRNTETCSENYHRCEEAYQAAMGVVLAGCMANAGLSWQKVLGCYAVVITGASIGASNCRNQWQRCFNNRESGCPPEPDYNTCPH
ncbi:MAG TPA: DUF6531 domain-containing protein [Pyrinomonadaceae bacterium]|nr:DUF6531 domain-containing protein [Pyrinomonadaceae bacterium]